MVDKLKNVRDIEEKWDSVDIMAGEELSEEHIDKLVELAGSDNDETAKAAIDLLHDISQVTTKSVEGYVEALEKIARDLDPEDDWDKIDDLIKSIWNVVQNNPESASISYDFLFEYHTHNEPYKSSAANALPYLVTERIELVESLIERLEDPSATNREESAFVLKKIAEEHPGKVSTELTTLFHISQNQEENSKVRRYSLEAIAEYTEQHPDDVRPHIQEIKNLVLTSDEHKRVREAGTRVLASYADQYPETFHDQISSFAELLDHHHHSLRWHIATMFREIAAANPEALEDVSSEIQLSCRDEFDNARDASLQAFVYLVEKNVITADEINIDQAYLRELVADNSAGTGAATLPSIKLLGYIGDSEAVPSLEEILEKETGVSDQEKKAAREAINRIQT